MIFKKIKFFLLVVVSSVFFGSTAFAKNSVSINFFADESQVGIKGRKEIVQFLKQHRTGDMYEFEMHTLSDPLKANLDMERVISAQGIFREYGVEIDKIIKAKVRFISGLEQKLIVIRKRNVNEK